MEARKLNTDLKKSKNKRSFNNGAVDVNMEYAMQQNI